MISPTICFMTASPFSETVGPTGLLKISFGMAVSQSKFSCNSNVSLVLDGPIGQYMHKYQEKENQEEESAEYKEAEATMKKFTGERVQEETDQRQ